MAGPSDWLVAVDKASGDMYFFNAGTRETSWELPPGVVPAGLAVPGTDEDDDDEDVDSYSTAPSFVLAKEGFLFKAPPGSGKWRKRWLVADRVTRTLTWYAGNPRLSMARLKVSEPVKGTLSLAGARVTRTRADVPEGSLPAGGASAPLAHELFVVAPGRTLHLCGSSAADVASWASYLTEAAAAASSSSAAGSGGRSGGRGTLAVSAASEGIRPRLLGAPVSVSAWVHKCSPDGRKWDERWASLKPESLTFAYYTGPEADARCCRVIDLRSAKLLPGCANAADPRADATLRRTPGFRLALHGAEGSAAGADEGRVLVFVAGSRKEAQTWVDAIHTAQEGMSPLIAALRSAGPHPSPSKAGAPSAEALASTLRGRLLKPGPAKASSRRLLKPGPAKASSRRLLKPRPAAEPAADEDGSAALGGGEHETASGAEGAADAAPASAAAAHATASRRPPLMRALPVVRGQLFKSGPDGSRWKERELILVPDASSASAAPGVEDKQCPCIAYYAPGKRTVPKGVIHLPDVAAVHLDLPPIARRRAPHQHFLTVQVEGRRFCFCARQASEVKRWAAAIETVAEAWNCTV